MLLAKVKNDQLPTRARRSEESERPLKYVEQLLSEVEEAVAIHHRDGSSKFYWTEACLALADIVDQLKASLQAQADIFNSRKRHGHEGFCALKKDAKKCDCGFSDARRSQRIMFAAFHGAEERAKEVLEKASAK